MKIDQIIAEGKLKCSCHPGDADPDCPVHGLEPMDVGDALDIKPGVAEGLNEFAPPGSNDGGDDGFSEETLKRLASQWYNGDEDPRVERTLMAAGWEIGQDEGYDDEPGVFVVQAGDINGNSYISWPAHELKQGVAEGNNEKIAGRHDPDDFDDMVARVKKLAGMGPLRTEFDPQKRVYRNVPVAVQPAQQPKK